MIFYFTGTGNSLWVAKQLKETFDEPLIAIADELKRGEKVLKYNVRTDEKIFLGTGSSCHSLY